MRSTLTFAVMFPEDFSYQSMSRRFADALSGVDEMKVTISWKVLRNAICRSGLVRLCIPALALLAISSFTHAQDFNEPDSAETPWNVLSSSRYVPDPSFNQGLYMADSYVGVRSNPQIGRKTLHLSNGDVIVAAVGSKHDGTTGAPPVNLILARYSADGYNIGWSNPGVNGYHYNFYVVIPNTTDPTAVGSVKDVLDIKLFGNRIFVLVDHAFNNTSDIDSVIHVFGTDGSYLGSSTVAGSNLPEYSGGMYIYGSGTFPETVGIAVVASTFNGIWRPTFISGTVNANSSITFAAPVFPNPGNYCPTNRGCILRSVAAGGRGPTGFPNRLYLAGTRQASIPDNNDWDFLVMAVNFNGASLTSFGGAGVTTVPFFEGGANYNDANSIQVETSGIVGSVHDALYVSGYVERECKDGFGVAKIKDDGALDTGFGKPNGGTRTGKLVLGGAIPSLFGSCSDFVPFSTSASYANASALANGKLAIAGFTDKFNPPACIVGQPCHEDDLDGMIAVIDTAHGDVDSFRTYAYTDTVNGPRTRHSGFWGISESGAGTFTATGVVRYFETAAGQPTGAQKIGTLRVMNDTIFASGFE